jgi:lactate racemase
MQDHNIWYGNTCIELSLPDSFDVVRYESRVNKESLINLADHITRILEEPKTRKFFQTLNSVAIVVDDTTRPTPSKLILPILLSWMSQHCIPKPEIRIIVALGAHKKLSEEQLRSLVGDALFDTYPVVNHEAECSDSLVYLGETERKTPIFMNTEVAQADLRILVGMIKPHNQAGYSGGGKSLLPGVCSLETIHANHSVHYMSNPRSCVGIIEGNPIRSDIDHVLPLLGPSVMVNVILDRNHTIVDVVGGSDILAAHCQGADRYDRIGKFCVSGLADICFCGTPDPVDMNFYQMLNSLSAPHRQVTPIIRLGGTIVVYGRAIDGISDADLYQGLTNYERKELHEMVFCDHSPLKDRPALQIFLECEERYHIIVITDESRVETFRNMHIEAYAITQHEQAIASLIERHGEHPKCTVLADAPYDIVTICTT